MLGPPLKTAVTTFDENITNNHHTAYNRQVSMRSVASSIEEYQFCEFQEQPVEASETRTSGSVSNSVYSSYFLAGGSGYKILFFFIICISTQLLVSGGDFWITYW